MTLGQVGIVVAARTASCRLPGKALLPLNGRPMVLYLLARLKPLQGAKLVLATTDLASDDELADTVAKAGVRVFRGSATDLVGRYVAAANSHGLDTVGRVTADCPFVNAEMVDYCLDQARGLAYFDLATTKGAFPVGLDIELYPAPVMARLNADTLSEDEREHLTLHFYNNRNAYQVCALRPPDDWPVTTQSFTVDASDDYDRAATLAMRFAGAQVSLKSLLESCAA